jgi:hypothetical protein
MRKAERVDVGLPKLFDEKVGKEHDNKKTDCVRFSKMALTAF